MQQKHLACLEALHVQWTLLQLAVQLDHRCQPSSDQQIAAAADEEVFTLAQKLGGLKRDFTSLGELRKHVLECIVETGSHLALGLSAQSVQTVRFGLRKRRADDVLFIARTLDRCVGMRSGDLTCNPGAQRALWSVVSSTSDRTEMPRRGPELIRQTCIHVLTLLEDWLEEEREIASAQCLVSAGA